MFRVRAVSDVNSFVGMPGVTRDVERMVARAWESGESRPEWCFVVEGQTGPVGRIGFRVVDTVSDPSRLGSLPPQEMIAFALHLPSTGNYLEVGSMLLTEATSAVIDEVPDLLGLE